MRECVGVVVAMSRAGGWCEAGPSVPAPECPGVPRNGPERRGAGRHAAASRRCVLAHRAASPTYLHRQCLTATVLYCQRPLSSTRLTSLLCSSLSRRARARSSPR